MQLRATKKKFPLEEAYEFAEDRGGELWNQVRRVKEDQQIRLNEPNQPSSIRRGLIIELFLWTDDIIDHIAQHGTKWQSRIRGT